MKEIALELIDKPEKSQKLLINLCKLILVTIATSHLYEYLFGEYDLITFNNENFWEDIYKFVITGRVLVIGFLFFSTYVIAIFISTIPMVLILIYANNKDTESPNSGISEIIFDILKFLNIIRKDKKSGYKYAGSNFDHFYDTFIVDNRDDNYEIENTSKNDDLVIFTIFPLLIIFALEYFLFFTEFRSNLITTLLIMSIICLSIFYYQILVLKNYYEKHEEKFIYLFENLKQQKTTHHFLEENKLLRGITNLQRKENGSEFTFKGVGFYIAHAHSFYPITDNIVQRFLNRNKDSNRLILVSSQKPTKKAKNSIKESEKLSFIEFKSEEKFIKELGCFFEIEK